MKYARGFTLMEAAIVVAVLGVVLTLTGSVFGSYVSAKKRADTSQQALTNQAIGRAFLEFATTSSALGTLPSSYTSATIRVYSSVVDPTSTTLVSLIQDQLGKVGIWGVNGSTGSGINDDGTSAKNVRVYQKITAPPIEIPVYYRSGPKVILSYEFGVVYSTACNNTNMVCNRSPLPGSSPPLATSNISTWTTSGSDKAAYAFSTFSLQKSMLETTIKRIDRLRDVFSSYISARENAAGAEQFSDNFALNLVSSANVRTDTSGTQSCINNGWYSLSSESSATLRSVGLNPEEYGVTAWGGGIEFCPDYRPGTTPPPPPPYYRALRINKYVSSGTIPSVGSVNENNVVFSF